MPTFAGPQSNPTLNQSIVLNSENIVSLSSDQKFAIIRDGKKLEMEKRRCVSLGKMDLYFQVMN